MLAHEDDSSASADSASETDSPGTWLESYFKKTWFCLLLLVGLGFAIHFPALPGQFFWDDNYLAHDNPLIRSPLLIAEAFRHHLFLESYSGHYRPVQTVSYIFDYWLWNNNSFGFHLTNVLCHCACGVLLFLLLRRILPTLISQEKEPNESSSWLSYLPLLLAAIWLVHPVHSAAVDYVSGRADSLAFGFACAGWLIYLRASAQKSRTILRGLLFAGAVIAALLSLCARESGALWLLLFLVHLFCFDRTTSNRAKLLMLAGCLAVAAAYLGLRQLPESRPANSVGPNWGPEIRAVLVLRALGDYTRLLLFPSNLHMERTVFEADSYRSSADWRSHVGLEYLSILGAGMFALFLFGALRGGKGQRLRALGAAWFVLSFLPISNILDLDATVAEHWLYIPSVGFLIFCAGWLLEMPPRWHRKIAFACVLAIAALSVRSAVRSSDWVDGATFFERTLAAGGTSTRVAVNLAGLYSNRGDYAQAVQLLRRVVEATPDYPVARNNLGAALEHLGKKREAEAIFDSARKTAPADRDLYPRTWQAAWNLAALRHDQHNDDEALKILQQASADYPDTWDLISSESEILRETNRADAAMDLVAKFADKHRWHARAAIALGTLCWAKGDIARAEEQFRHASRLDVHDAAALNQITLMKMAHGQTDDACKTQQRAVAREPDEPRQYLLLADVLQHLNRSAEAASALAHCHELEKIGRGSVAKN